MKITTEDKQLMEMIDFITDRFFGVKIIPYQLANAIGDWKFNAQQDQTVSRFTSTRLDKVEKSQRNVVSGAALSDVLLVPGKRNQ